MMNAISSLPNEEIKLTFLPFKCSELAWIGGSLFASVKVSNSKYMFDSLFIIFMLKQNFQKYAYLDEYRDKFNLARGDKPSDGTETNLSRAYVSVPDWMSINPADWKFSAYR
jgi:hypothetical protein